MPGSHRSDLIKQVEAKAELRRMQFEAANAKLTARAGRNLVAAIGVGLGLALVVLVALFIVPQVLVVVGLAAALLALYELATAFRKAGRRVPRVGVALGGAAIIVLTWLQQANGTLIGLFIGAAILLCWRVGEWLLPQFHIGKRSLLADIAAGIFCLVYIPFLLSLVLLLAQVPKTGSWWVFLTLLLPIVNDTGAYVVGLNFGKHKMSPRVSPNKTWEGFFGAGILVVCAALAVGMPLLHLPWFICVILAIVALFTATGGDLIESLIKRNLGVKDMSSLMPGHGGILDRLDSILPTAVPVFAAAVWQGAL